MKMLFALIIFWAPYFSQAESLAVAILRTTTNKELKEISSLNRQQQIELNSCQYEWQERRMPYHCFRVIKNQTQITFSDGSGVTQLQLTQLCEWSAQHQPENYIYSKNDLLPPNCRLMAEESYKIFAYKKRGELGTKNVN